MRAIIDKKGCMGCGMCQAICPEVFEMANCGYAQVKTREIPGNCVEYVIEASEACPMQEIVIA